MELEDLRAANDLKVARLESELAEARAAMTADQESLQDKIFELEDQVKEEATKMLHALEENGQLLGQIQELKVRRHPSIPGLY